MLRFFQNFLFGSKIASNQVGPFTKKEFRLRPLGCINKILRHVRLWSVGPKVTTVGDRSLRGVNKEPVGPRNAMIHVDRFYLDLSETQTVSGSERFELYSFEVVLEASWTNLRQRLEYR